MLLAPSPAIQLHASYALSSTGIDATPDPSATTQLRTLTYAARWDVGVAPADLLSDELSGEKWFVWAAGNVRLSLSLSLSILACHVMSY